MPTLALALHSYGPPMPSAAANTLVSNLILNIAIGSYILAFGLYLSSMLSRKGVFSTIGRYVTYIAIALHASGYLFRWKELYDHGWGRFPLSTFYEALIFYCLLLAFMGIALQLRSNRKNIMVFFLPFIVIVFLVAKYTEFAGIRALYESDSYYNIEFIIFVYRLRVVELIIFSSAFCFLSTAGISSVMLIVSKLISQKSNSSSSRLPAEPTLYELNKKTTLGGFALLCLGTFLGAYVAKVAWGVYWSWDPSETSRVLFLITYAYIIFRNTRQGWLSIKATNRSILGNCVIVIMHFFTIHMLQGI